MHKGVEADGLRDGVAEWWERTGRAAAEVEAAKGGGEWRKMERAGAYMVEAFGTGWVSNRYPTGA